MTHLPRQYPRYAIEAAIEFVTPAGTTQGRTQNVSRGGLAASVERPIPPGLKVDVRMSLVFDEDTFSEPLVLPARVVWCTPLEDGFQLGTAFLPMSNEQRSYLAMFLRYLKEGMQAHARDADEGHADDELDPFA
jgi:hypothetical protein